MVVSAVSNKLDCRIVLVVGVVTNVTNIGVVRTHSLRIVTTPTIVTYSANKNSDTIGVIGMTPILGNIERIERNVAFDTTVTNAIKHINGIVDTTDMSGINRQIESNHYTPHKRRI